MKLIAPPFVSKILTTFSGAGYEIYIVGGAVRDLLMDRTVNDWDFTTNATPEIILGLFPGSFYDNQFGTVGVVEKDKTPVYEITTFRQEADYSDQRHPNKVVWGKTLFEDLVRRDLTINAMALRPNYELIDPYGGQKDIKAKLIRAVGNPNERFTEDALRMMRAIRIATQLGFAIEKKTFSAIKKSVDLIDHISTERIRDELLKLLSYPYAADGYLLLRNSGLAQKILPEVEKGFGVAQKSPGRHHIYDVGTHSLLALKNCRSRDPIVKLATLLHDVGKPLTVKHDDQGVITFYNHEMAGAVIAGNIGRRLRLSNNDRERLVTLVRWHQFTVDERQTDSAIRRFITNVGKENLQDMLDLRTGDRLGGGAKETSWRLEEFKKRIIEVQKQPFSINDVKINGHEVMKILQIPSGPLVGKILTQLFAEVVADRKKNNQPYLAKRVTAIGRTLSRTIEPASDRPQKPWPPRG